MTDDTTERLQALHERLSYLERTVSRRLKKLEDGAKYLEEDLSQVLRTGAEIHGRMLKRLEDQGE